MKNKWLYLVLFSVCITAKGFSQSTCPIIPLPNQYAAVNRTFILGNQTSVIVRDEAFRESAYFLENEILRYTGISVSKQPNAFSSIVLQRSKKSADFSKGSYWLEMNNKQITISAADDVGVFNGIVSLLQLVMESPKEHNSISVKCWNIKDYPAYAWRGLMLDESRHFFGKHVVKKILDQMALLKLNRFHWHLTDQPGWRIQIKKYPWLTLIGGIGNYSDSLAPAAYYTQEDIREIIAYANERHITVIPEIDMPGHATAANRAYQSFSGGGSGKFANFTFNPGKEGTYQYLTDILREVSILFPSGWIHLGGDEVSFGSKSWATDTSAQTLMHNENLKDLSAVEHYFFRRMTDSALKLFRKVLAWDEVADASLPPDSIIIFWWRQDKPEQLKKALEKSYDVVLCPRIPLYFDFVQDSTHKQGRRWGNDFSSLEKVYNFSDSLYSGMSKWKDQVLGIQANLWTETVASKRRLEFLLFPRIAALAEAAWTKENNRDYQDFLSRLKPHLLQYKNEGIYYFNPFSPAKTPEIIDF